MNFPRLLRELSSLHYNVCRQRNFRMTTARQVQVHVSGRSLKINIFRRLIANPWCSLKLFKIILCQCNLKRKKLYCLYPMYRTISTIMGHAFYLHPGAWFFSETDWYWYYMIVVSLIVSIIWRAIKKIRVRKLMCIVYIF